ncbi:MAG: TetR/AcrR family transcriptional regulator [Bacteroidaceae bacterium]|nr:TetR/AcrR family transcriptional regulator [Bacteroidaceae bacterium]
MTKSKTKAELVDVARNLFAKKGLEETTMNDIAKASQKGRRTLYTYFKNKEDIYYAVVESELERLADQLEEVAAKNLSPEVKILEVIYTHLRLIKEAVVRNGNLRAEFFRNIWLVERTRSKFDRQEILLLRKIMKEGIDTGAFEIENVDLIADITHYCVKGLEVPYIYGRLGRNLTEEQSDRIVARFVQKALGRRRNSKF